MKASLQILSSEQKSTYHRIEDMSFPCFESKDILMIYYYLFFREERCSESSTLRKNYGRRVSSTGNQNLGKNVDMLLTHNDNEYGSGEAGLKSMDSSQKVLVDATLKNPKVLKDMIWSLSKCLDNTESLVRRLQLAGFTFNSKLLILRLGCSITKLICV